MGQFLGALKQRYPKLYVLALIQIGLGLRIGEVLGIYWDDLDLDRREAVIQRNIAWNREKQKLYEKKRKNGKILEVVIPEFLAEEFKKLKIHRDATIPYVFHRNGKLLKRQQVSKAYNRVLQDLKITYVTCPHYTRTSSNRKRQQIVYGSMHPFSFKNAPLPPEKVYSSGETRTGKFLADDVILQPVPRNRPPGSEEIQDQFGNPLAHMTFF